jgi:hypothetical protein
VYLKGKWKINQLSLSFGFLFRNNFPITKCARWGAVISLGYDGYSTKGDKYWCEECTQNEMDSIHRGAKR